MLFGGLKPALGGGRALPGARSALDSGRGRGEGEREVGCAFIAHRWRVLMRVAVGTRMVRNECAPYGSAELFMKEFCIPNDRETIRFKCADIPTIGGFSNQPQCAVT